MEGDVEGVSSYGWTVSMAHNFVQKRVQKVRPTFAQIIAMLPLSVRYLFYYIYLWFRNRMPVMDFLCLGQINVKRGAPIGGIGCGSIGRSITGDFCNFQMSPGVYESTIIPSDQFIVTIRNENQETVYQKVLTVKEKAPDVLKTWDWGFPAEDGKYIALYPRSWYVYHIKKLNVKLICRQISPVIPNNYKDSSLPGAVFVWTVVNKSKLQISVSITFTFKNGTGSDKDDQGYVSSEYFDVDSSVSGVSINQQINELPCTYLIGCTNRNNSITRCPYFNPKGSGKEIWSDLRINGELKGNAITASKSRKELAVAVCSQFIVPPQSSESTDFCLVWFMPIIKFPQSQHQYYKYFTRFDIETGNTGKDLVNYCLQNYPKWEILIDEWQKPILEDDNLPRWYKYALFNELYYISDSGSVWLQPFSTDNFLLGDPRSEFGHFAYLEGQEYKMYNTYDVHYYASFALSMLWPKIQSIMQYDFRDAINTENHSTFWYLANGQCAERKKKNTVPHDLGDPGEDPFFLINSYPIHDVSQWRDLNLKFVLQVYRDYLLNSENKHYLIDMFPQIQIVMKHSLSFDLDDDGMIENSGSADQTYDCWTMTGTSAYCGGLWLAALHATIQIASILEESETSKFYSDILTRAKEAFDKKLWNGKYYNFDCSLYENHCSIMSDQLCGVWYLKCVDPYFDLLPEAKVKSAIKTIYENNVLKYYDGQQGAVNGMLPNGTVERSSVQSEEVWTGVTYAVSALLISLGFVKEGFKTAEGLVNTIYNKSQLAFCTPEAIHGLDAFRSYAYMRPLSIWSMQLALQKNKPFTKLK